MGKIFCIMGKSSSGKDAIYKRIMKSGDLDIQKITPYTTRPIRINETDGEAYHFCDEEEMLALEKEGKVIERRDYNTACGVWSYFTVDDGGIDLDNNSYLMIGTIEAFIKLQEYFGNEKIVPIYIEVDDGDRLERALKRERKQSNPKFEEMCRRFLADQVDFSEEKIIGAGITKRFTNEDMYETIDEIKKYMRMG